MQPHRSMFLKCLCLLAGLGSPSLVVSAQTVDTPARATQAVRDDNRVTLQGNIHPLAQPQFDRGVEPDSLPIERMLLVLRPSAEQEAALTTLLSNQQNSSSPDFHRWLTPEQFGQRFGPADADLRVVTDWLASQGFQLNNVSRGRTVIEFSGNAGLVRRAFHTEIHRYVENGEEHWANGSDPQIPAALAPVVVGIVSLHNFPARAMRHLAGAFSKSRATGEVKPITPSFTFSGCGATCNALGPNDFATIYNVLPLWNSGIEGTGEIIAIAGESNINVQDVRNFRSLFGLPANDPRIILNGSDPGLSSEETESDLDVEWAGAVARNAAIDLVVTASGSATNGVSLSAKYIVDNNFAPVMSVSFGLCELFLGTAGNQFFNQEWQQAAAQGITVVVAAGDSGAASCDAPKAAYAVKGLAVSGWASTPYNVAVGGTDFNDELNPSLYWNPANSSATQASAKGYIPETAWNDSCANPLVTIFGFSAVGEANCNDPASQQEGLLTVAGGGGGASNCTTPTGPAPANCAGGYAKPSWQTGTGVPGDGKRDVPDVSLFAGNGFQNNFYIVCENDVDPNGQACSLTSPYIDFLGVGGTSVSAPAFAGVMAMVDQKTGSRQGNGNPMLYKLASESGSTCASSGSAQPSSCIFYDITAGTIAMPCLKGSPDCTTSLVGDSYGILSGYGATTGYDLATGLGSVNAANLVGNWSATLGSGVGGFQLLTSTLVIDIPSAGQMGSTTVTVTGVGGFAGSVNLTCSVSPTPPDGAPGCSFSPSSITLSATTTSATGTLEISTTAAGRGSLAGGYRPQGPLFSAEAAGIMMVCFALVLGAQSKSSAAWLALAGVVSLGAMAGCGGGGGSGASSNIASSGTPSGDYIVAIRASSGNLKQTTNVFVTIP
jgi:hypothetical protein